MKLELLKIRRTIDLGGDVILLPGEKRTFDLCPQELFRSERLFIEEEFGVTLEEVKIGTRTVKPDAISTLFYSVPTNPKTIDRIRRLIIEHASREPESNMVRTFYDDAADPESVLGLPVGWGVSEIGNLIRFVFKNNSADPLRVTVVLRGSGMR